MNTQITLDHPKDLKLHGMAQAYQAVPSIPVQEQSSPNKFIVRLTEAEIQDRTHKRTEKSLLQSKLRYHAFLDLVHCNYNRNLSQEKLMMLGDCSFLERADNLLITGANGCGKSYLIFAIGHQPCSFGYRIFYFGINRFLERISNSKLVGSFIKLLNQFDKTHLLILDEFVLHPLDGTTRLALFQILEDWYGKKSVIITSQLPVPKWHEYIGEPTIADAIMDRLAVIAHRIDLIGESLKRKNKLYLCYKLIPFWIVQFTPESLSHCPE